MPFQKKGWDKKKKKIAKIPFQRDSGEVGFNDWTSVRLQTNQSPHKITSTLVNHKSAESLSVTPASPTETQTWTSFLATTSTRTRPTGKGRVNPPRSVHTCDHVWSQDARVSHLSIIIDFFFFNIKRQSAATLRCASVPHRLRWHHAWLHLYIDILFFLASFFNAASQIRFNPLPYQKHLARLEVISELFFFNPSQILRSWCSQVRKFHSIWLNSFFFLCSSIVQ